MKMVTKGILLKLIFITLTHKNFPFLLKRMKNEKVENLMVNLYEREDYVIYKENLKQTVNYRLILKGSRGLLNSTRKLY